MRVLQLLTVVLVALVWIIGCLTISTANVFADAAATEQHIEVIFSGLRDLKPMMPGENYTLRFAGVEETGTKDQFLRRRTAQEISNSGLSCGCGDYAILFLDRIEPLGFETHLVDAAEISWTSLRYQFSGHAVVAIRSKKSHADSPWWLVDPTNQIILSRNWLREEKSFQVSGRVFWIGYCGPLSNYPVNNQQKLRAFYTKTLESVPLTVLNHSLDRFKFNVDPSFFDSEGKTLNPRLENFIREQPTIFANNEINPDREVTIKLARSGDDYSSELTFSEAIGWVGTIGLKSGCSTSLFAYFENKVRSHYANEANSQ